MVCACIDIGSNTTRLLVAQATASGLLELATERAFTRLGHDLRRGGRLSGAKIDEVADVVAAQARLARELGAGPLRVVATAALREASNQGVLTEAVRARAGVAVEILSGEEEGRLAFAGATRGLPHPPAARVAVTDVGGASTELALGTVEGGADRCSSLRLGSGLLHDAYGRSDPPSAAELRAMRNHVAEAFDGLAIERPALAVAVGGSATSLRRLVGAVLEPETLQSGLRVLAQSTVAEVSARFDIEPERVRLLPAGMVILAEVSRRLDQPLRVGRGGLREGVIIELSSPGPAGEVL